MDVVGDPPNVPYTGTPQAAEVPRPRVGTSTGRSVDARTWTIQTPTLRTRRRHRHRDLFIMRRPGGFIAEVPSAAPDMHHVQAGFGELGSAVRQDVSGRRQLDDHPSIAS